MTRKSNINPEIQEKFKQLNLSSQSFQAGGIYMTKDNCVLFPGRNKIEDKPRMVVVLGRESDLNDPLMPIVSCAPITTVLNETTQCMPIDAGDGNLDKPSLIKAGMIQPILKTDLSYQVGTINPETLTKLKATVFMNLGLDEGNEEEVDTKEEDGDGSKG